LLGQDREHSEQNAVEVIHGDDQCQVPEIELLTVICQSKLPTVHLL
jgi:hypothetical protein